MDFNKPVVDAKEDVERVGGFLIPSGIYMCTILMAFIDKSKGGAECLNVELKTNTGQTMTESFWITNKKGETFYTSKAGDKVLLPGFQMANRLCVHTTGKTFIECGQEAEEKVIEVYDYNAKKKVNKTFKQVFTNLIDESVLTAILAQKENKRVKNNEGKYVNGPDIIEKNYMVQFFNPDTGKTLTEIKNNVEKPEFLEAWKEKNKGKIRDNVKAVDPSLSSDSTAAGNTADSDNPFG